MTETFDTIITLHMAGSDSIILDRLALLLTSAYTWIPLYLALVILIIKNNDSMPHISITLATAILCVVLSSLLADVLVKPLVERVRPCNVPEIRQYIHLAGNLRSKDYSFFSAHAANTMSVTIFFALLVRSRLLTLSLVLWSLIMCWTRLYLAQHYMTDILFGLFVGLLIGTLCYILCQRLASRFQSIHFISSQYSTTGYSLADASLITIVILLTIIASLIMAIL